MEIAADLEQGMLLPGAGSVIGFGKNGTGALGDRTRRERRTPVHCGL